jgi:hypothetical protein
MICTEHDGNTAVHLLHNHLTDLFTYRLHNFCIAIAPRSEQSKRPKTIDIPLLKTPESTHFQEVRYRLHKTHSIHNNRVRNVRDPARTHFQQRQGSGPDSLPATSGIRPRLTSSTVYGNKMVLRQSSNLCLHILS